MNRPLFALIFVVAFAIPMVVARATLIRDGDYEMRGKYQGVLFCSDCPGIWTQVTLEDNGPDLGVGHGTFVMTQRYSGGIHRGETVVTTGTWSAISRDEYMTSGLLRLLPARRDAKPRYFRCEGGRRLSETNGGGMPLTTHLEQSMLMRVIPPETPAFAPLTQAEANRTIYGRVGDRFSIDLTPKPIAGATPNPQPDFSIFALVTVTQLPTIPAALDVYGQDAFVDIVAANPGTAKLTFRSRSTPTRLVSFEFEIRP